MDPVYGILVLAPLAVIVAFVYVFTRRRRIKHKKVAPPVRPSAPIAQRAPSPSPSPSPPGIATPWPPPAGAHAPSPVAATVVVPPSGSPSWDQAAAPPANAGQPTWG